MVPGQAQDIAMIPPTTVALLHFIDGVAIQQSSAAELLKCGPASPPQFPPLPIPRLVPKNVILDDGPQAVRMRASTVGTEPASRARIMGAYLQTLAVSVLSKVVVVVMPAVVTVKLVTLPLAS